ncbi:hypothetical protein CORC01_12196 [Colletotrichum orchidophilum]|uniref:Uncharacterized protein n=1 Tax=Colletotrichum orchidophilum TaxID=1209926 RepID=A0A1G4ATK4_9PEZI|nr:uncharacterized protein CORC01_12196 [Colletotrichum orchidophilum]OHE92478.1 hypothetical protein CORC01_12196 [Colletotrichum orchidophilum]
MDASTLTEPRYLYDRLPAGEVPKDILVLKDWYFTRCKNLRDAKVLQGVYNTLILDLGVTPEEMYKWKKDRALGYRIANFFDNPLNEDKIAKERMKWVKKNKHIWGSTIQNYDTSVFAFTQDDHEFLRSRWPKEWKRYSVAQIEWALEIELEQARRFLPKKHERSIREENWRWLFGVERWVSKIAFLAFDASGTDCEIAWKE